MDKYNIAQILREMGTAIELTDPNPKKGIAYRRAARVVESMENFEKNIQEKKLTSFRGIGEKIAEIITTLSEKGTLSYHEELMKKVPQSLLELALIPGLNLQRIRLLYERFGIKSISELEVALKEERIRGVRDFGPAYAKKILKQIASFTPESNVLLYPVALNISQAFISLLKKFTDTIEITGCLRRKLELIPQIDLIATTGNSTQCLAKFTQHQLVRYVIKIEPNFAIVMLKQGLKATLTIAQEETFPLVLLATTGNSDHLRMLNEEASQNHFQLTRNSLINSKDNKGIIIDAEQEIYKTLKLPYIVPELREGYGEIEAAKKGFFRDLIQYGNLKGTFHCHTTYSDGRNTLEEMADQARKLGWQYIGIADHSKSTYLANGMNEERLLEQIEQIKLLNQKLLPDFQIFSGIECDILNDGSLDFSAEILDQLDFVIVSVHRNFKMEEQEMTVRVIKAVENPSSTILGHLTGRLLRHRDPYRINVEKVIDACIANNKIIELNGYPDRLDMDWRYWIQAHNRGLKCCITPDAHSTFDLKNCAYGVNMARKGWLSKQDVINTLSLEEMQHFLKRK